MAATQTKDVEKILAEQSVTIPIDSVKPYHKNPRIGDVEAIAESLAENGQFRPIIVSKRTGEILGGNHTWKAAKHLGWKKISAVYVDVDEVGERKIVLADNRTNDLATYDTSVLTEILASLPSAAGTGYSDAAAEELLKSIREDNQSAVEDILRPPITTSPLLDDREWGEGDNSVGGAAPGSFDGEVGDVELSGLPGQQQQDDDIDNLDDQLGELQGILQLREDMDFKGNNYWQIPDLARSGLVDKLPDPIDTWGGQDATPDDGVTTWVWNYGVAARKGLPMDRAILTFYTYDTYFESFWDEPAFMTAKMLNAGIKMAVVPDFSYYSQMSTTMWLYNHFRAQWLGRFFQEAGIKVIPRIQFAIDKIDSVSLDFNTLGIPKNSPVVAKCSHNANSKEEFEADVHGLRKSLEKIQPETLLMYGGNPAKRIIEAVDPVAAGLCSEVVHIYNYAHKRRGVVFDKKEGLAGMKKDQRRKALDAAASAPQANLSSKPPKQIAEEEDTD